MFAGTVSQVCDIQLHTYRLIHTHAYNAQECELRQTGRHTDAETGQRPAAAPPTPPALNRHDHSSTFHIITPPPPPPPLTAHLARLRLHVSRRDLPRNRALVLRRAEQSWAECMYERRVATDTQSSQGVIAQGWR